MDWKLCWLNKELSQIQILTSKITQVCQDIHDIKLRRLLITQPDQQPNVITNCILTNHNDYKDTQGSSRSKLGSLGIHEGGAEDGNDYIYKPTNLLKHDIHNNQEDHETCPPQLQPTPSRMTPEPHSYPDPFEASEKSSLPPASLLLLPKKDNIKPDALLMYTERPSWSWNLCLVPTKKNGGFEPEEESEMREGIGLMMGAASPCLEFSRGTGIGVAPPDRMDLVAKHPLLAIPSAL